MKLTVTPLRIAFAFMMTPAVFFLTIFVLILHSGKDQLILIVLTNILSFYAGMGSTASTMMTGKDFFHTADDTDVPPPAKITKKSETTIETTTEPASNS